MAGKIQREYPPDEELRKGVLDLGASELARRLDIPRPTLLAHLNRQGLPTAKAKVPVILSEPEDDEGEVSELEILRQQVAELESAAKRDRKGHVQEERVIAAIEDAIRDTPASYIPKPIKSRKPSHEGHEFVLLFSDTHAAEIVSLEETNGINAYNWEIMLERMDQVRAGVASYAAHRPYPIKRLRILMLGDMLSGDIHDELSETNQYPLAEAQVLLGKDLANFALSFTEQFEEVRVDGIVGNHPRAKRKPQAKKGYNNADWTAYQIASIYCDGKVQWDIPKANQHVITVAGRDCLLFHGDGIRSSMPGVPWGGVSRRVNALAAQYRSIGHDIYAYFCGHFHTANLVQTPAGWIGMNGSVKGPDEYSIKAFGGGAPAQQTLLTFHPEHGLTDFSVIDL